MCMHAWQSVPSHVRNKPPPWVITMGHQSQSLALVQRRAVATRDHFCQLCMQHACQAGVVLCGSLLLPIHHPTICAAKLRLILQLGEATGRHPRALPDGIQQRSLRSAA